MRLGIVSDSHDNAPNLKAAIELLQKAGAQFFIHCGDVCAPPMLDHFAGLQAAFVWGNCDWDRIALQRYAQHLNINCFGAMGNLEVEGKSIAILHGDDFQLRDSILSGQKYDYVFQGHTHIKLDHRIGKTRHINPGALQRATIKTVALLDTKNDSLEFLTIPTPQTK